MSEKIKHYVEFEFPGLLFPNCSTQEVERREISAIDVPENCFAFRFFDVAESDVFVDGVKQVLKSARLRVSPRHYYGGTIYTTAELCTAFPGPEYNILRTNAECNGWNRIIQCRTGNFQPLEEGDIYVNERTR